MPQSSLPPQRLRNGMRPYRDPLKSSTVNTSYDDRGVSHFSLISLQISHLWKAFWAIDAGACMSPCPMLACSTSAAWMCAGNAERMQ